MQRWILRIIICNGAHNSIDNNTYVCDIFNQNCVCVRDLYLIIIKLNFVTQLFGNAPRCFSIAQRRRMVRRVLNYSVRFYMFTIPFLMAYSISDNTTFSATRKIVSYHREMASPCAAFASLSLFSPSSSFSLPYLPLQAAATRPIYM